MITDDTITAETFTTAHVDGAHRLSQAARWPHRAEDWSMFLSLSRGIVMHQGGELVATALTTPFGPVATLSMIIVDERLRRQGIGQRLMGEVMALAQPAEWRLIATADGQPLYERLGFEAYSEIVQHQGIAEAPAEASDPACVPGIGVADESDATVLAALDEAANGMQRHGLIKALLTAGKIFVLREGGSVRAFAGLRAFGRGEVLGPVVAPDIGDARRLIAHGLTLCAGRFLRIDTNVETGLGPWLAQHGLAHVGGGIAMRLGEAGARTGRTFALAAQALG